jgi:simple sugar transport system permease protein
MSDLAPFLEAIIRTATPLLIAAIGETVSERAGVINIALEGCIIAGAYAAFVVVAGGGGSLAGYGAAVASGLAIGLALAAFAVALRRDQIIVGTALTLLALGVTGTLFRARGDAPAILGGTQPPVRLGPLADIPVVGSALFAQPVVTYLAFLAVPGLWFWLYRTQAGLALRAVGDAPEAAEAAGVRVRIIQSAAVAFGSALGGITGAALVLAQSGSFAEGMSAGRGFLAIAVVALGRWRPLGVAIATMVFGAAMALQFVVQAMGWSVRYELVLMIPYLLTLAALGAFGRGTAPAMLGRTGRSGH